MLSELIDLVGWLRPDAGRRGRPGHTRGRESTLASKPMLQGLTVDETGDRLVKGFGEVSSPVVPRIDMTILNIGCGTKTSSDSRVINLDWSMYLVIKGNPILSALSCLLLSKDRLEKLNQLSPSSILVHDLRKGIPFGDESIDVVYHSHFLEHLDRPVARVFLDEAKRVLKPDGIQRIVVPDMGRLCANYLAHLQACVAHPERSSNHDSYLASMIEQMVRREAYGTSQQTPVWRTIERRVLGDARKQGQTHQWMYDRINLPYLLREIGYRHVTIEQYDRSVIPDWERLGLDRDEDGGEYKPGSLYVEAVK